MQSVQVSRLWDRTGIDGFLDIAEYEAIVNFYSLRLTRLLSPEITAWFKGLYH